MTPSIFAIGNKDVRVFLFAVPITCRAEPLTVPKQIRKNSSIQKSSK
jgi:hypothetical protein